MNAPPLSSAPGPSAFAECLRLGTRMPWGYISVYRFDFLGAMADVEQAVMQSDEVTPERHLGARDELRRLQQGLQKLPHKCRQIVELRKIYGLSQREVAGRLGIAEDTVERQTLLGMRALADFMLGGTGKIQRPSRRFNKERSQP